ncbi:MAG: glycoside hydrolase 100 family protein [Candidatus Pacearchaeota archaeon]
MDIRKEAYNKAIKVIELCSTPYGFFAAYPGYDMVFARDAIIISLGASLLGDKFKKTFEASLITLGKAQSNKGQIPNAVDNFSKRKHHTDYKSIDSTLWYIIGHYIYKKRYNDNTLFNKEKVKIKKAINWLSYLDIGEDSMIEQLPTTDWQDAFPHKYGHTINTQALYYFVLKLSGQNFKAEKLKYYVNKNYENRLWDNKKGFYLPWRWKNHNKYQEKGEWFDSLGNLLAIVFGLANKHQAEKILSYIKKKKIEEPYPIKAIFPPIKKGTKEWHDYFLDSDAGKPYHYLNGGIWTFIGGFYILALIKLKKLKEAERQFKRLTKANLKKPEFNEWLHGKTGKVGNSSSGSNGNQGWNAGMYILAYESLKENKVIL